MKEFSNPPKHLPLSSAVSFALAHHAYPLAARLVKEHRPRELILNLPSHWEARDVGFARLFDGVPVSHLTLAAYDSRDADAAFSGPLPGDLTRIACRMIESKTTHEVTVLNALPAATRHLVCRALESAGISAFHLLPRFSTEAQLVTCGIRAAPVLAALGNCPTLRTLSVNLTGLGQELSSCVLSKGILTSLMVDMHHFEAAQALDDEDVAEALAGLQYCRKLESLTFRHSRLALSSINAHVVARLAGNVSLQEFAVSSDVPLHGRDGRDIDALATTFELLNTCTSLKTFRLECASAESPARTAVRDVYAAGKESEYAVASARIAQALRASPLRKLIINGLVLHPDIALGLAQGIGTNACLQELDLSGCTFTLNDAPEFIRRLMANESICLMAMPRPQTMIFLARSDGILYDLAYLNGGWTVDAAPPGANAEFDAFEGDGAAYAQNFSYLACATVAHRNAYRIAHEASFMH